MTAKIPAKEFAKFHASELGANQLPPRSLDTRTMSSMDALRQMAHDHWNQPTLGPTAQGYVVEILGTPSNDEPLRQAYLTGQGRDRLLTCMIVGSDHGRTDPYFRTYGKTTRDLSIFRASYVSVIYDPVENPVQVGETVEFEYLGSTGVDAQFRIASFRRIDKSKGIVILPEVCDDNKMTAPTKFNNSQNLRSTRQNSAARETVGKRLKDLKLTLPDYGISNWTYPLDSSLRVGSSYGPRVHPISGQIGKKHGGVDLGSRSTWGTPVYAAADGVVTYVRAGISSAAGHYVEIYHGNDPNSGRGVYSRYLHLTSQGSSNAADDKTATTSGNGLGAYEVIQGERVSKGHRIGRMGNTGGSTGAHLHFVIYLSSLVGQLGRAVHKTGTTVNPILPADAPATRQDISQMMQGNPPLTPQTGRTGKPSSCGSG